MMSLIFRLIFFSVVVVVDLLLKDFCGYHFLSSVKFGFCGCGALWSSPSFVVFRVCGHLLLLLSFLLCGPSFLWSFFFVVFLLCGFLLYGLFLCGLSSGTCLLVVKHFFFGGELNFFLGRGHFSSSFNSQTIFSSSLILKQFFLLL